jgi:hypothetical protein
MNAGQQALSSERCFRTETICSTDDRLRLVADLAFQRRQSARKTNFQLGRLFSARRLNSWTSSPCRARNTRSDNQPQHHDDGKSNECRNEALLESGDVIIQLDRKPAGHLFDEIAHFILLGAAMKK